MERVISGKLDLSDEVIVGTTTGIETTRSFRRMPADQQRNPETLRMCQGYRGTRGASLLTHLEELASVASRGLWCKSKARESVAQPVKEIRNSLCQSVENGLVSRETAG